MKQAKLLRSFTEKAGLHMETLSDLPLLELCGEDRILVENHKCVVGYTEREIIIRVSFGLIEISGEALEISRANKEQLIIYGRIRNISLVY